MSKQIMLPLLLIALLSVNAIAARAATTTPADSTHQNQNATTEANLAVGQALYMQGLRADGKPLTAIVSGDVEILGTQFSCESCHGISGMGSKEASVIVPIIAGSKLFAPAAQPARPAYDVKSLAKVLRDGVTPTGRKLDGLMPRFRLTDNEVQAMAAYLRTLTTDPSPGVGEWNIRFATVVTDNSSVDEQNAVLAVLKRFAEEKSRQTRIEGKRWDRGTTPESRLHTVHRDWVLDIWKLTGDEAGWAKQLSNYYKKNPVFAVIGGLLPEHPEALARFCEQNAIPCILPSTRYPVPGDGNLYNLYSLYYSAGLGLEADLMATHLKDVSYDQLIQVYCQSSAARAADRLEKDLIGHAGKTDRISFDCAQAVPVDRVKAAMKAPGKAVVVLWLDKQQLSKMSVPVGARVYLSSTLIGDKLESLPVSGADSVTLAHQYRLPGKIDPAFRRLQAWAKSRKISLQYPRLQSEAFFSSLLMSEMIKHLDGFYTRKYMLDLVGHTQGMDLYLPYYPRATFGPGQIFINKGGYLLPVVNGKLDTGKAEWIIPEFKQ
jgi:mono/diheme cytochrome c family protein